MSAYMDRMKRSGERLFYIQHRSGDGYNVKIDDTYDKDVIILKHSNPLKDQAKDLKLIYLDSKSDGLHWGSKITGYLNNEEYMIITEPSSDGIKSTCKIRRLENNVQFKINNNSVDMMGILANGVLYSDRAYVDDGNVFEQDDKKALIVQYNENTSKLQLFDAMTVDGNEYKIVQIDDGTMRNYGENFGVLQIVLIDTQFGSIKRNNEQAELKCVLRYARVKDKVMNSKSREIMTHHNKIKTGDYITHVFDRDSSGVDEKRTYIVRSMIDMYNGYDSAICYNCDTNIKLLDDSGNIHSVPIYVEDNRARIDKINESQNISILASSYMFTVQDNHITRRLMKDVFRIIVKDEAYRLTGKDNIGMNGIIMFGMEIDTLTDDDQCDVANYKSQMEKLNPTITPGEITGEDFIYLGESEIYTTDKPCTFTLSGSATLDVLSDTSCEVKVKSDSSFVGNILTLYAKIGYITYQKQIYIRRW